MIRVAFRYKDPRFFSRAVCLLQGGDSAHCEIAWKWENDTHICVSASFLDGGVRTKSINMSKEKWRIYEMQGSPELVRAWLFRNEGAPYDVLGLMGFIFRRIKGWRNAWFCSEVAAEVLGLPDPWRYDLNLLESICIRYGTRVN